MSIQWTFIAGYLYFEIVVVTIMMLPIASPRRWNKFFESRLFAMFRDQAAVYFYVLLGVLGLFLMDAIREMRKYSHSSDGGHVHLTAEMKSSVKMFRAQRNFYITGFAIFLAFVIRRLVTMIIIQAKLLEVSEKRVEEAEAAKNMAKTTLIAQQLSSGDADDVTDVQAKLQMTETLLQIEKDRVAELERELASLRLRSKCEALKISSEH